jgi:hypothetical protein
MNVVFWDRAFSSLLTPLQVQYKVERYSHSVVGGPKSAEISVRGTELDLWELAEYVRRPVQIFSEKGDPVWWGYVAEIKIDVGLWSVGVNVDTMANYIGVAYEDDAAGGQTKITAWTEALDSTAEYGRRELLFTTNGTNSTHALAARDKYLAEKKYPTPVITPREKGENGATLYCRGWFDTLAWKYASIPLNLAGGYTTIGTLGYSFGDNNAKEIAQSIKYSGTCNLASISVYVKKVGAPADNLKVSLCANTDDITPGTELTSGTIAGTLLTTDYAWYVIPVGTYSFSGYNSYFIKLSRSGSQDVDNYYSVELDEAALYPSGIFNILIGSNWATGPAADMPWQFYSNDLVENAQQIATLASIYGQFITGVQLDDQSGIYTASARDGLANDLFEITELMKMGTSNYRRMLCEVTIGRRLRIYEEPAISSRINFIIKDGTLKDPYNTVIRKETCPVGIWTRLKDIVPASVDTTILSDPNIMFIDEAEYIPDEDRLNLTPRGFVDPFSIGVPKDG